MIQSKVIADSVNDNGDRLTTFEVVFPRIVLAETNTHRAFSRNSASSRAIPFNKMKKMVQDNPFIPLAWQKGHRGMQGSEYISEQKQINLLVNEWLLARDSAVNQATELSNLDLTKQLCNRLLEPFMWHKVIITSSEDGLENFFKLRCPQYKITSSFIDGGVGQFRSKKDYISFTDSLDEMRYNVPNDDLQWLKLNNSQAEIHIQALAEAMWDSLNESTPKQLKSGEWHIPYADLHMPSEMDNETKIKVAISRCARLSYMTLGDNPKIDFEKDIALFERLKNMEHFSPFEHVACAMKKPHDDYGNCFGIGKNIEKFRYDYLYTNGMCRNFYGFVQYRALLD